MRATLSLARWLALPITVLLCSAPSTISYQPGSTTPAQPLQNTDVLKSLPAMPEPKALETTFRRVAKDGIYALDQAILDALPIVLPGLDQPAYLVATPSSPSDPQLIRQISAIEDANARKSAFLDLLVPIVDNVNETVLADRRHLIQITAKIARQLEPTMDEIAWLQDLARRYETDAADHAELKRRVDLVPLSLALSQAALESGWGTSRLARDQLALFGQTDGGAGFASFPSLEGCVTAYVHNLNTHGAYAKFRAARATMRAEARSLDGYELAGYLTRYSELGRDYTQSVKKLIKHNDLHEIQEAALH